MFPQKACCDFNRLMESVFAAFTFHSPQIKKSFTVLELLYSVLKMECTRMFHTVCYVISLRVFVISERQSVAT
jgi:hypothetical protein